MKTKNLAALSIGLIGFYSIFSALFVGGMPVIAMITSFIIPIESDEMSIAVGTAAVSVPIFVVPFILGLIFIMKAKKLSEWLCRIIGLDQNQDIGVIKLRELSFVLYSMLGIFMLSRTVPEAFHLLTWGFIQKAQASMSYTSSGPFEQLPEERIPDLVYHIIAVGFSAFVFFRSVSISNFLWALRKGGHQDASRYPDKPGS